jgi:hypothetical protein
VKRQIEEFREKFVEMLDWVLTGFAIEAWDLEKKDLLIEPLCAFRKR